MELRQFAPPRLRLRTWMPSPQLPRTWFVLDSMPPSRWVCRTERPRARTPLVRIYDLVDEDNDVIGGFVQHRPMTVSVGRHYLSLVTAPEDDKVKATHWHGGLITLLEGPNGATLFHHCEVSCPVSEALKAV